MRPRTSIFVSEIKALATLSKSCGEELYLSQFAKRWAAVMLPPDTLAMQLTSSRRPSALSLRIALRGETARP